MTRVLRQTSRTALEVAPIYLMSIALGVVLLEALHWIINDRAIDPLTTLSAYTTLIALSIPIYLVSIGILHSVAAKEGK